LLQKIEKDSEVGFLLSSGIAAAPHDELLFDSVSFYLKTVDDGYMELIGKVHCWNPTDGHYDKSAVIRTFDGIDKCLEWLTSGWPAVDESADILADKCH